MRDIIGFICMIGLCGLCFYFVNAPEIHELIDSLKRIIKSKGKSYE